MIYDVNGNSINSVYDEDEYSVIQLYDVDGNPLIFESGGITYDSAHSSKHLFAGGLIEIQPDSWDGSTVCTGDIVQPSDPTAWGFPMSLSAESKSTIKNTVFSGDGYGISFIRFPMGFAYRGYRNIDAGTGLAKNIGQRWDGQNTALNSWFADIADAGGGLDVEYWCHAPYWITGGAYYNPDVNNEIWAGGAYPRTTTLESIRLSDPTQYRAQIDAFTDAIVDDLEYVHQNIAPVRMYTLAAEPSGSGKLRYGHTHWTQTVYEDVFIALHPKVMASRILAAYRGKPNVVLMHLCADHTASGFAMGTKLIEDHQDWIWGYSHDYMRSILYGAGADWVKNDNYPYKVNTPNWDNVENMFICEFEYFILTVPDEVMCSNNIVRMINELWFRKAKIIMPVIHICKPTGQGSEQTNTKGYSVFPVDMTDGSITQNAWTYNSWMMFNDNLPIGAELYQGGDGGISYASYVFFKKSGKTYLLMGNYASVSARFAVTFDRSYTFSGKQYDINHVGTTVASKSGSSITFEVPAYTGLAYICEESATVVSITGENDHVWEDGYYNDDGVLTAFIGAYVRKNYTPASGTITITITNGSSVQNIRVAEYDANHSFIKREYGPNDASSYTVALDSQTRYIKLGFQYRGTIQSESTLTSIFDGGYEIV